MPMGIVSDDEFEKELNRTIVQDDVKIPEVIPMTRPGRSNGDKNVPDGLRKIIGETSEIEGRAEALALAEQFGISPSSVSAYANGSTSTASMNKTPNREYINGAKDRVSKKAMKRLLKSIDSITDDKLEGAKATDLASIAKSLSGVIKDMEPEEDANKGDANKPAFIIFAPQVHQENHYEVTKARE